MRFSRDLHLRGLGEAEDQPAVFESGMQLTKLCDHSAMEIRAPIFA